MEPRGVRSIPESVRCDRQSRQTGKLLTSYTRFHGVRSRPVRGRRSIFRAIEQRAKVIFAIGLEETLGLLAVLHRLSTKAMSKLHILKVKRDRSRLWPPLLPYNIVQNHPEASELLANS